jgi:hypothetical protein
MQVLEKCGSRGNLGDRIPTSLTAGTHQQLTLDTRVSAISVGSVPLQFSGAIPVILLPPLGSLLFPCWVLFA